MCAAVRTILRGHSKEGLLRSVLLVVFVALPAVALAQDAPANPPITVIAPPPAPQSLPGNVTLFGVPAATPPDASPTTAPAGAASVWLDDLAAGYRDAADHQRPILLIYGAEWCGPCRALAKEMNRPEISGKLAAWTLVHLDVDHQVGPDRYTGAIPAMRVLTSKGKSLAEREGYFSGEELLAWLNANAPAQVQADPDLAVADAPPDAAATARLVSKLGGDDALAQESAIRRLAPWPGSAAKPVVELFAKGNLRSRLAAMELLQNWRAPIEGIDPWTPQTITPARIEDLRKWSTARASPATQPAAINQPADTEDLEALLRAASPEEASVITQRLARAGPPLMPLVIARTRLASSDRDVERLTALRYTIVASAALLADWPGGVERLASRDAAARHGAAEELAGRAKPADEPLLGELFSDPDPLVRELSLHALQNVGGADADRAMLKLLHDPDLNVRAAVLKELAESPSPDMVNDVMQYVSTEQDPDLVVHAERVLREAKTPVAEKCLLGLFAHPSWRVRAEAVDGLSDSRQKRTRGGKQNESGGATDQQVQVALIKLLDDPDGYVAGRAVAAIHALGGQNPDMTPLTEAAKKHPKLALDIITALSRGHAADPSGLAALRSFASSNDPEVRRAALKALLRVAPTDSQAQIEHGLADSDPGVQLAATDAAFAAMQGLIPANGMVQRPAFLGLFGGGMVKVTSDQWLADFRSGKLGSQWMTQQTPALRKMLASADPEARFSAALPLAALGHDDEAMPVILEKIRTDASRRSDACALLPWLSWDKRSALFHTILKMDGNDDEVLSKLCEELVIWKDPRSAEPLWTLLADARDISMAGPASTALQQLYGGDQEIVTAAPDPSTGQSPTLTMLQAKSQAGSPAQRITALVLCVLQSRPQGFAAALAAYHDEKAPAELRKDAYYVALLTNEAGASDLAVTGLSSADWDIKIMSLRFLCSGARELRNSEEMPWLRVNIGYYSSEIAVDYGQPSPVVVKPPPGLKPEPLKALLSNSDPEKAAEAGYLLCLLGDKGGLPPLVAGWRAHLADDAEERMIRRLVYRAISALDDDSQTPVLAEVYGKFEKNDYSMKDFYWTIRAMHGPNILALRKKMRDEVGMTNLQ
jgi:HEAT repeat protein